MFSLLLSAALASTSSEVTEAHAPVTDFAMSHADGRHEEATRADHRHRRYEPSRRHDDPRHRRAYPPPRRGPPPPPPRPVVVVRGAPAPAPVARAPARKDPTNDVSLTLSALHLAVPMAAVNAEFETSRHTSLGMTFGFGTPNQHPALDLGLEGRGYMLGNFDRGLYLGAEGRITSVPFYTQTNEAALAGAVFFGAKTTFKPVPFTLDAQIGPQFVAGATYGAVGPMVQLSAGFSF